MIDSQIQKIPDETPELRDHDLFPVVWPYIEKELHHPKTEMELAEMFKIEHKTIKLWLSVGVEQGRVIRLLKPVRYVKRTEKKLINNLD